MRAVFLVILFTLCLASRASEVALDALGRAVSIAQVSTVIGSPDEDDASFLLRQAHVLSEFTRTTGFEACSQICHSPGGAPGLLVTTNRSHIGCVIVDRCPSGMLPSGLSVHSHPHVRSYEVNDVDLVFLKNRAPAKIVRRYERRSLSPEIGFSPSDYLAGPGYLIDDGFLFYQNGPGTMRPLGEIERK